MTIKSKIKEILRKEGSIDNFYCIDNRITTRLGATIHLLRQEGWEIEGHKIPDSKNWIYTLVSEPKKKGGIRMIEENGVRKMLYG